jgi:hypothetical protein
MESPNFEEIIQKAQKEYNTQNVFIEHKGGSMQSALDFMQEDWKEFSRFDMSQKDVRDYLYFEYMNAETELFLSRQPDNEYSPGLYALRIYYGSVKSNLFSEYNIGVSNGRRLFRIEQKKIKKAQEAEVRKKAREDAKVNPVKDMLKYLRGRSEFCEMVANCGDHPSYGEMNEFDILDVRASAKVLADKYCKAAVSLAFAHIEGKGLAWAKDFAGYDPYNTGYTLIFRFDVTMKKIIREYETKAKKDANAKA